MHIEAVRVGVADEECRGVRRRGELLGVGMEIKFWAIFASGCEKVN